jgi:HSP20 family protein
MTKLTKQEGQVVPRTTRDLTPFEEMDRLFDHMLEGGFMRPFDWRWPDLAGFRRLEERMPRVDVIDREAEVLVRAEIPGIEKDQLELTLSDDLLTIKGETREEKEEKGEFYRSEIHRGSFTRTVRLPDMVVGDKARARFENGLLEITIPKAEKAVRHTVKIA